MAATSTTNVVISGANRGLGAAFVKHFLARPNHTVIGLVRDTASESASELRNLPAAKGSSLILLKMEATSTTDAFEAAEALQTAPYNITKVDVIVANAGMAGQQGPMETIEPASVAEVYITNAVGPTFLFRALKPLLDRAPNPKWVALSSAVASIETYEKYMLFKMYPYNASKAALNHFTKTIHIEYPNIVAFAVSPGWAISPIFSSLCACDM
jgi:norsolorinic acid ketoreductase